MTNLKLLKHHQLAQAVSEHLNNFRSAGRSAWRLSCQ